MSDTYTEQTRETIENRERDMCDECGEVVCVCRRYLVGIGGTPREQHEEYEDLVDAEAACLRMAEDLARSRGINLDTLAAAGSEIGLYENGAGETLERGACPAGDDGAYWPHIEEVTR